MLDRIVVSSENPFMATCVFPCSNKSNILQVAMESVESEGHHYFIEFFRQISENSKKL